MTAVPPSSARTPSLFIAETPRSAAEAAQIPAGDVRFMDHVEFSALGAGELDLTQFEHVFLGSGAGGLESARALLDMLGTQAKACPTVNIQIEPELDRERWSFLTELHGLLEETVAKREAVGAQALEVRLRASAPPTDAAFIRARAASREIRQGLEAQELAAAAARATEAAAAADNKDVPALREALSQGQARINELVTELEQVRRRSQWRHNRVKELEGLLEDRDADLRGLPVLMRFALTSGPLRAVAVVLHRLSRRWKVMGLAAAALVGLTLTVLVCVLGWTSSLGAFGAVLGLLGVAAILLLGLLAMHLVGLRAREVERLRVLRESRREFERLSRRLQGAGTRMKRAVAASERQFDALEARTASVVDASQKAAAAGRDELAATVARLELQVVGLVASAGTIETAADHLESRSLTSLETAGDRIASQVQAFESTTSKAVAAFEQRANAARVRQTAHLESAMNLFAMSDVSAVTPQLGGWAASADVVRFLLAELTAGRPSTVVECGSGASTLWMALTVRRLGLDTRIVALEHDEKFRAQTIETLRQHGVAEYADVRFAPLRPLRFGEEAVGWYDASTIEDLEDIGLLFVDGPPGSGGPLARYPAVPLLKERLAADAVVVLDDMVRDDEKAVAAKWQDDLPDFTYELLNLEKGAGVFRRTGV